MAVVAEIVSFLVHNGHGCFTASLLPAAALQAFLGYNETRGIKFERKKLFTDFWMTVAQASQEVDRLLALARRHAEVAVAGLHSAGLRDEASVMVWMRKHGRNEGERIRLQEMLDRMGVGVGARVKPFTPFRHHPRKPDHRWRVWHAQGRPSRRTSSCLRCGTTSIWPRARGP